jgi:glyoxylate/hydroxypyruvate reductase
MVNVLICSYLEPELVEHIRALDQQLNVEYHPDLLPKPRYQADHVGEKLERTPEQHARWLELLGQAEVLFDFDYTATKVLPERAPNVRWIQASSAGIGQFVHRLGYARMNAVFTTSSGVHARPLAEYTIMSMLEVVKQRDLARQKQVEHHWQRFSTIELSGKTLAIVGLGKIGLEVAKLAKPFDMIVIASKRNTENQTASSFGIDALYNMTDLHDMLSRADFICLAVPHTPETENLIDQAAFNAMKSGAVLINIARGAVVVESAMIAALELGKLAHAALDVVATEPLPADSPLWDMPNVSIYHHSASTNDRENIRIVELFCQNLKLYLNREPLLNTLDIKQMY